MLTLLVCTSACRKRSSEQSPSHRHENLPGMSDSLSPIRFRPKWHPQAQFSGVYMARKMGFYEDFGLKLDLQPVVTDQQSIDSLLAGKGDVIHIDLLSALNLNRDSTVVVNIAQISQKSPIWLVGRKSRGIRSLQDFQGKKLGMWRSGSNLITQTFLKDHNIQMEIVPIDWSINLFTQQVVDVINVMQYNEYHQLLQSGIPEDDLFVLSMDQPQYNIPDEGFYVRADFYQQNQALCEDFAEATMDGWTYAITHPQETITEVLRIMQEARIRANSAHQSWMLNQMKDILMANPDNFGRLSKTDFDNALKIMQQTGKITRNISYEEFYPRAKPR